jgi:hypothetical protein
MCGGVVYSDSGAFGDMEMKEGEGMFQDDNRCPICAKEGHLEFLSNKWDANGDCWYETCTSEGSDHDCEYYMSHIDRRRKVEKVEHDRRRKG